MQHDDVVDGETTAQSQMKPKCRIPQRLGSPRPIKPPNRPSNIPMVPATVRIPRSCRGSETRSRCQASRGDSASVKQLGTRAERQQPALTKKNQRRDTISPNHKQETINMLEQEEIENVNKYNMTAASDVTITKIQHIWKKHLNEFEALKRDLDIQQKDILKLFAALSETHKAMSALGQDVKLPSIEDLRIMNVAHLTPSQLLKLCSDKRETIEMPSTKFTTVEINTFLEMPTQLVSTCEMTLQKRMEIIEWFQSLKSEEKGISVKSLTKKINEFIAENEMLSSSLNSSKADFMREVKNIVESLRSGAHETAVLRERTEILTDEVSELTAENTELRKKLLALENMKFSPNNKYKIEELEKELKEEKFKKTVIKDRLTRAESQVKTINLRVTQLEAALELARSHNWTLERTVQQLNEQNQKLQLDFDKELVKLTDSIKDNTAHLQEIAEARETLQTEKETLEIRLQQLSASHNESLKKLLEEVNTNEKKLQDTEKKLEEETDERKKLESKLESLCAQLFEAEVRYKDLLKQMQAKDEELSKLYDAKCELDATSKSLQAAETELEDYKERMLQQTHTIEDVEQKFQETISFGKSLQIELRNKEEYIAELEKKQLLLEDQLREGEQKMESYENQLNTFKMEIAQVHEEFGEFANMSQFRDMVNEQRERVLETTRKNGELAEALQQKELELQSYLEKLAEHQQLLDQKDGVIKMITEKEEEQANIIKLLRNNLELRAKADCEINQKLSEKDAEIKSLVANLEARKQQISQLEQIILTIEDQLRKVNHQRRRDRDKLSMLEKALIELEAIPDSKLSVETAPVDNLDNLIKILEDELGPFDPVQNKPSITKKLFDERKKLDRMEHYADGRINDLMRKSNIIEEDKPAPKSQKQYSKGNHDKDNLDRKKAITNMETQIWLDNTHPINIMYHSALEKKIPPLRGGPIPVVQVIAGQLDDKKGKMFKFAGHHL